MPNVLHNHLNSSVFYHRFNFKLVEPRFDGDVDGECCGDEAHDLGERQFAAHAGRKLLNRGARFFAME